MCKWERNWDAKQNPCQRRADKTQAHGAYVWYVWYTIMKMAAIMMMAVKNANWL